jgi:hypothetical protein
LIELRITCVLSYAVAVDNGKEAREQAGGVCVFRGDGTE